MNSKLKAYVEMLFAGKPDTSNVRDAKEELLSNLNDKYNDLIKNGKSETDAYQLVISGIGEIDELFQTPQEEDVEISKIDNDIKMPKKKSSKIK